MAEIEFPFIPRIVQDAVDYYLAEHHNRQERQLAGITERVNRFWPNDEGRPVPNDTDKYPLGFNEAREAVELWNGEQWIQLPNSLVNTFLGLSDTPGSYEGQAGKVAAVNEAEDGIEFVSPGGGPTDYAGRFEQAGPPTPEQIPDGKWGFWWNTSVGRMVLIRNRGDTMFGVEATPL